MKRNYQKELDKILEGISGEGRTPSLLLHSCCAPCSSYVLEYLSRYFRITVFYYNPNIYPEEEYRHRVEEQKRLIGRMPLDHPVDFAEGPFNCGRFYEKVRGTEDIPEGGRDASAATSCASGRRGRKRRNFTAIISQQPFPSVL